MDGWFARNAFEVRERVRRPAETVGLHADDAGFATYLDVVIATSELNESMNESDTGRTAAPRPFCALFDRTKPPGTAIPELEPWPAMPLLATDPLRLMIMLAEVDAGDCRARRPMRVGAAL